MACLRLAGQHPSLQLLLEHVFASCRYSAPPLDPVSVRLPQPSQLLTIPVSFAIMAMGVALMGYMCTHQALALLNNNLPIACRVSSLQSPEAVYPSLLSPVSGLACTMSHPRLAKAYYTPTWSLSHVSRSLPDCQGQWQRLFSTTHDGQSFATFMYNPWADQTIVCSLSPSLQGGCDARRCLPAGARGRSRARLWRIYQSALGTPASILRSVASGKASPVQCTARKAMRCMYEILERQACTVFF